MTPPYRAVASIHDVRPDTLDRVAELLDVLRPHAGRKVALLIVPGLDWSEGGVARLREWAGEGYELAGHGWVHERAPRTLYHRLHARIISRDQAEHLSVSRAELVRLIERGRGWFDEHGLPAPVFYVPPAWALGRLEVDDLARVGYRWVEVQWGYVETTSGTFLGCPLIGFETDTRWREFAVGISNTLNVAVARRTGRPLRIGLHPFDLELRRAGSVPGRLAGPDEWLTTAEAVEVLAGD